MATLLELPALDAPMSEALDKVRRGEEVTVSYRGHAVARLVPLEEPRVPQFETLKGMVEIVGDFNEPLPEEVLREWEQ